MPQNSLFDGLSYEEIRNQFLDNLKNPTDIYKQIEKQNSKELARAIRDQDSAIFAIPGIVEILKFVGTEPNHSLISYLSALKPIQYETQETTRNPFDILDELGYNAIYADSIEKKNSISKYFHYSELLCTFDENDRHVKNHVINCVSKNVDNIHREDYIDNAHVGDDYSKSVFSIQFDKLGGPPQIIHRWHNTTGQEKNNALFGGDLSLLHPELPAAFQNHFNVSFKSNGHIAFKHHDYIVKGKNIVKHNYSIDSENLFMGDYWYATHKEAFSINKKCEVLMNHYILDVEKKRAKAIPRYHDGFIDVFNNEMFRDEQQHKNILIEPNRVTGHRKIFADKVKIVETNSKKRIIFLHLENTTELPKSFMEFDISLAVLVAPKLKSIPDGFLGRNNALTTIYAPELESIGRNFLPKNIVLKKFYAPKLKGFDDELSLRNHPRKDTLLGINRRQDVVKKLIQNNILSDLVQQRS